jgi:hypothetical protein
MQVPGERTIACPDLRFMIPAQFYNKLSPQSLHLLSQLFS